MKVLVYTTSSNDVDKLLDSLKCIGQHDVHVFRYDRKWHDHVGKIKAKAGDRSDPSGSMAAQKILADLSSGTYRVPSDVDVAPDVEMIREITRVRPDIAIYISAWEGAFVPMNVTLAEINRKVPLVHHCCDAGDPPWWPQMVGFDRDRCFTLTWNIDGAHDWPGGRDWDIEKKRVAWGAKPSGYIGPEPRRFYPNPIPTGWNIKGLTTLTPVDPSYYQGPEIAFADRPFRIGYAGNFGGWMRKAVIEFMQKQFGQYFAAYQRDDNAFSYANYCEYLRYCQCVINVPFSGSNAAKQVKGRIVEAGWAGACVLEWAGAPTAHWFEPGDDYEEYNGLKDLGDAVESILTANPSEIEEMAQSLAQKVRKDHTPEIIWNQVFAAAGVELKDAAE